MLAEIKDFVELSGGYAAEEAALASVLCLRCDVATDQARMRELIAPFLAQYRGGFADDGGDITVLTFDGPARAIRAGLAIIAALIGSSADAGAGLHTGECLRRDGRLEGAAVDLAMAIARRASAGELLISRTVKDLVAGGGFRFVVRGRHRMPRELGEWRLYSVDRTVH